MGLEEDLVPCPRCPGYYFGELQVTIKGRPVEIVELASFEPWASSAVEKARSDEQRTAVRIAEAFLPPPSAVVDLFMKVHLEGILVKKKKG